MIKTTRVACRYLLLALTTLVLGRETQAAGVAYKLTYDKPASDWNQALPIGNGRIGAMDFGGAQEERLQINEGTLWAGAPRDYVNPDAYTHLKEIQQLIFAGKVDEAQKLAGSLMGEPPLLMPYQPFCDIRIHSSGPEQVKDFRRELDLDEAVTKTEYTVGSARYHREAFISYPDQVLVVRITSSEKGKIAFDLGMDSPQPGAQIESQSDDTLQLRGQIQPKQNPPYSWTGSWKEPGMRFAAVLKVSTEGGSVNAVGDHLSVAGADAVTILFSNSTSFRSYRDIDGDAIAAAQSYLSRASARTYAELRRRHEDDFHKLFSRVRLDLGPESSNEPTDKRIKSFAQNEDPSLLALYFEYGRYLLISSSRQGGQPANLQGIWNDHLAPPWGSKWTTNINLEMNYWQADVGDLWETEAPLWNLVKDLRVTGAKTAQTEYHSDGWVLHHNTDLWRATAPVDGYWGIWPMGEAWLANQMWDHYEFSNDREFLKSQAYPAMKEAAEFVLGFLVEAPAGTQFAGRLVTNPSTSPENNYVLNGKPASLTYAATMDIELTKELFENCRKAAAALGTDADFQRKLEQAEERLPPVQIGRRGQLQEWIEDYPETEPKHRHVSHLYSLYPGHDISLEATPDLANAAKKTLELRGDGETGWSQVWRVALWARLRNSVEAYTYLKLLLETSTLPNMFDLCGKPFQIDGNLGGPGAITEMLVQSSNKEIAILPALPSQWQSGSLTGVRLRGGGRIDLQWNAGHLTSLKIEAAHSMRYRLTYGDRSTDVSLQPNVPMTFDGTLRKLRR